MLKRVGRTVAALVLAVVLAGAGAAAAAEAAAALDWSLGPETELAPGVTYRTLEAALDNGDILCRGHALRVDASDKDARLMVVPGGERLGDRQTVSALARKHGALAAVNGGFFSLESGHPEGNLVLDGRLVAMAGTTRTAVSLRGETGLGFGMFAPVVRFVVGDEVFDVNRFNRHLHENGVSVYTPDWGEKTPGFSSSAVLVRREDDGDRIIGESGGPAPIPADGYVVVFNGRVDRPADLTPGTRVDLEIRPATNDLKALIQGGPLLVEDGKPLPGRAVEEGFSASLLVAHPRTAAGVTAKGDPLLVVVDGRLAGWSTGLQFDELAVLMVKLGAVRAAALDGGGSSTMWVAGKVLNKPSAGSERRVANALLVRYGIPVFLNDELLFFDVPAMLDNGRTMVPLRGIFEEVGATVEYEPKAQRVTATRGDRKMSLVVGNPIVYTNNRTFKLDVPAGIYRGRTLVPLRFIGESLGAVVDWDEDTEAVYLTLHSSGDGS